MDSTGIDDQNRLDLHVSGNRHGIGYMVFRAGACLFRKHAVFERQDANVPDLRQTFEAQGSTPDVLDSPSLPSDRRNEDAPFTGFRSVRLGDLLPCRFILYGLAKCRTDIGRRQSNYDEGQDELHKCILGRLATWRELWEHAIAFTQLDRFASRVEGGD